MDLGFDVVVTVTGIVLVFLILVLLMAIITLEGKIFDGLGKKKAAARAAASKPAAPAKPLPRCSRPLLRLPRWRKAFPVMWWLPSWPPSTQWAMASTPSGRCAAAPTAGARPV